MDNLFKQLRSKNPNVEQEHKEGSSTTTKDKTIPPQKTQSFKGEKRRTQSWIKRQFSGSMSRDADSINEGEGEYQIAVAAAAFAVKSLEESRARDERRGRRISDTGSSNITSNTEDTAPAPAPAAESRTRFIKFLDEVEKPNLDDPDRREQITAETREKMPEKAFIPAPAIKKKLSFTGTQSESAVPTETREKTPEKAVIPAPAIKKKLSFAGAQLNSESAVPTDKAIGPAPSIKKTSSFDKSLNKMSSRKSEIEEPKLEIPAPIHPPFLPADVKRQSPMTPDIGDIDAEAWERGEMARIKEKYEKSKATILDWEQKKKTKAKRRLERIEAELDKRRAKTMKQYRSELVRIEGIAGGARSQAEENRRNEEFKVKDKANKIRLTGKLPATCWCF